MPMRILLTNDDGIDAPGLQALNRELQKLGDVTVVAPAHQQSATGHAISLHRPLVIHARGERVFSVDGTPADAVKLALRALMKRKPDAVVSGMNFGLNCGCNILYSGTLAGALEGAQHGLPAFAVSLEVSDRPRWKAAASVGRRLIQAFARAGARPGIVININIPAGRVRGVAAARQEMEPYLDSFERRRDPRGRTYYWYRGMKEWHLPLLDGQVPTDQRAVRAGYVAVTPLHRDLTRHDLMADVQRIARDGRDRSGRA